MARDFLRALSPDGETSRKRIYHSAGFEHGEAAVPDALLSRAGEQIGASCAEPRAFARVESLDPFRMDKLLALDERLVRQFEKAMGMLTRLQEARASTEALE